MSNLSKATNEELRVLRNVSLPEIAYRHLSAMIMSGAIEPGAHINESQIADDLGINRAPLREACRRLQQEGLVKIEKNRGAFLRDIPVEEATELYEIRAALEGLAAQNAANLWTDPQMDELRYCLALMREASERADKKDIYAQAACFHQIILNMAGNKHLKEMVEQVSRKISVFRFKLSESADSTTSCADEEAIVRAIENRDGLTAFSLMRDHVLVGKARVLKNFIPPQKQN